MTNEDQAVEATGVVRRLRDGRFRDDELDVVLNCLTTLLGDHDINLLHVPEDAGDYRTGIVELLLRIPDGWGRWMSCDTGWYPLIRELGRKLATIDPDCVVHQIKEEFETLRFYAETELEGEQQEHFDALIAEAQDGSRHICERCGSSPAELCTSGTVFYSHVKTLCDPCCEALHAGRGEDYRPVS